VATNGTRDLSADGDHPASLADRAYVELRDRIITTEISPGSLLQEAEWMRRIGVGRTPMREAIQRLRWEGFVTVIPRRGTLVSEIHITDLAAIYEVRAHLEAWEAGLAAERATPAEHAEAAKLIRELKALSHRDGFEALLALDRRVHRFVYRCGKNLFLAETVDQYHNLSLRILYVAMARYPSLTPRLQDVVGDQLKLLEAIIGGDSAAAQEIAAAHIHTFEAAFHDAILRPASTSWSQPKPRSKSAVAKRP